VRVTQAVPVTEVLFVLPRPPSENEVPLLAPGIKLCLRPPASLSPPTFQTYITVEGYCGSLFCFTHPWAGRSQVTIEINQMAPVHPKSSLQDSMLKLTGADLLATAFCVKKHSETEFRTRTLQTFCEISQLNKKQ
jgi:hypothetical protein